jgi:hypothetical protein
MLAAIRGGTPDRVPLAFMIFESLRTRVPDWFEQIDAQIAMGLDAVADMTWLAPQGDAIHPDTPGVPVGFHDDVQVKQWKEQPPGFRWPVLHKHYKTPAGALTVAVNQTDDWEHGDDVPLFSDFLVPRCIKYMVEGEADLPALRHLLAPPRRADIEACREMWRRARRFAHERGVLLAAGWGVGADALGWLCGLDKAVWMAMENPQLLDAVLDLVGEWNRVRMELMLEPGPDLFLRRAWYEGAAYWSPGLFRRFLLPRLRREVEAVHDAGAAFGYILTMGGLQFADLLAEAGIDVLIGVDPTQDHGMDMAAMKQVSAGRFALWGGVNGFVTVELGKVQQVRKAVRQAVAALGPDAFILSPVDNVVRTDKKTLRNVDALIDEWTKVR